MANSFPPIVLIFGEDSLRADRALTAVLKARDIDASEVVRIWGDESSFAEVFAAAASRSLFSDRTVVVVRRAEKLRGAGGGKPREFDDADSESGGTQASEEAEEKPPPRKTLGKSTASGSEVPELDPSSSLILVARKADRRTGMWKKVSKVAETIDAEFLKGKSLTMAAAGEARALGLRVSEDVLRETVEQSGPSLGRIVSEFEKMLLYEGSMGRGTEDLLAVTSSPPLYRLADALMGKDKRQSLALLDEAQRQGEAGLRVLATAHGAVRKLAVFRSLRRAGVSSAEAGAQAGLLPFKVADTERAARGWSEAEIARSLAIFAEADRRLKLSAPAAPLLTHALARITTGGQV